MSKRLMSLFTVVMMLAVFSGAQAHQAAVIAISPAQEAAIIAVAPAPNGIIMSDGRICNPRWGC